jgi:hypothetical protein
MAHLVSCPSIEVPYHSAVNDDCHKSIPVSISVNFWNKHKRRDPGTGFEFGYAQLPKVNYGPREN